ncbi:hypothetical protein ABZ372_38805 [Streptomyces sp. NPDC005921]
MTGKMTQAALLITVFGLISAVCAGLRLRQVRPGLAVLTDFLVAAGIAPALERRVGSEAVHRILVTTPRRLLDRP